MAFTPFTVTVTDKDGDSGTDSFDITVNNVNPSAAILADELSFPGGDYFVFELDTQYPLQASAMDEGSDDLTFGWNFVLDPPTTHYNNGIDSDPAQSPLGTYPFQASHGTMADFANVGVELLALTVTDDDGGLDNANALAIVLGAADQTQGDGWWKHQYSGNGIPHIGGDLSDAYLGIVNLVSSVFSDDVDLLDANDATVVLSANGSDARAMATRNLLAAWLHFASGAVAYDADVDGAPYIDVMFLAEAAIKDLGATKKDLQLVSKLLMKTRHA